MPLVSVVIPAYNATRTLATTVDSALRQTVSDIEVVIVDDGSNDETLAVARSIADRRVRVLTQANAGAAAARNAAIGAASGKYVAFLDADDLWLPNKLQRQLDVLERPGGPQAVQCGAVFINDRMEILSVHPCSDTGNAFEEALLFQNLPAILSALVVRRDRLNEIGGFDPGLVILEEWDMALKAARYCGMRSVPDPLVLYRVHPGNRHRDVDIHIAPGLTVLRRLFDDPTLPAAVQCLKAEAFGTFYRTLAGGYFARRSPINFLRWAWRALVTDPAQLRYMMALPLRRYQRWRTRKVLAAGLDLRELLAGSPGAICDDSTAVAHKPNTSVS